jgi:hypothetical protein
LVLEAKHELNTVKAVYKYQNALALAPAAYTNTCELKYISNIFTNQMPTKGNCDVLLAQHKQRITRFLSRFIASNTSTVPSQ